MRNKYPIRTFLRLQAAGVTSPEIIEMAERERAKREAVQVVRSKQRAEMQELINRYTLRQIATQRGISAERVRQICSRLGVYNPRSPSARSNV